MLNAGVKDNQMATLGDTKHRLFIQAGFKGVLNGGSINTCLTVCIIKFYSYTNKYM